MFNGLVLSDVHFGASDSFKLYNELSEYVFGKIDSLESLSIIIIAGDYFDHLLSLNETATLYATKFLGELIDYCKNLNIRLRIVYGTESHECNQYQLYERWFISSGIDYKIIKTVSDEYIDDIHILYIPEEHIFNKREYYNKYINNDCNYDYIFGHGVINELMPAAVFINRKSSSDGKRAKVPTFSSGELSKITSGDVFFGHYHINCTYNDNVHYMGSFTRWCFGEEPDKGFYYFEKSNNKYYREFIVNDLAPSYVTVKYSYDDITNKTNEEIRSDINKSSKKLDDINNDTHIRYIFNIPDGLEDVDGKILSIRESLKDNKNIKFDFKNGHIDKMKTISKDYLTPENIHKYSMLFDKTLSIEDRASQFIKSKYDQDISPEVIKWHISCTDVLTDEKGIIDDNENVE